MSTNITEAQVVAFLKDRALEIKTKFGVDKYAMASVEVALYGSGIQSAMTTRVSIGSGSMDVHCAGTSFAEAWAEAAPKEPVKLAALKREHAARLLAEADALSPVLP